MSILEQINDLHPVRKSKAQKKAFRQWCLARISERGWKGQVEQNNKGKHMNLVVGDPDEAQVIFTAHYDTPATIGIPDMQIPRNIPVNMLWHMLIIGGMLLIAFLVGVGVGLITGSGDVMVATVFVVFVTLMLLQLYGVPNRSNVNDNTSGVATLLEMMGRIPEEYREKVAFIFFDNTESGRRGSLSYAREHLTVQHVKLVVNLDCVGVGEHILVAASRAASQCPAYGQLVRAMEANDERSPVFGSTLSIRGNSDHRSFSCGVGVMACERVSGIGYCLGNLHTARDTVADQGNIDYLAGTLSAMAETL